MHGHLLYNLEEGRENNGKVKVEAVNGEVGEMIEKSAIA